MRFRDAAVAQVKQQRASARRRVKKGFEGVFVEPPSGRGRRHLRAERRLASDWATRTEIGSATREARRHSGTSGLEPVEIHATLPSLSLRPSQPMSCRPESAVKKCDDHASEPCSPLPYSAGLHRCPLGADCGGRSQTLIASSFQRLRSSGREPEPSPPSKACISSDRTPGLSGRRAFGRLRLGWQLLPSCLDAHPYPVKDFAGRARLRRAQVLLPGVLAARQEFRLSAPVVHCTTYGLLDERLYGFGLIQHCFQLGDELRLDTDGGQSGGFRGLV